MSVRSTWALLLSASFFAASPTTVDGECGDCVRRSDATVKVVTHGIKGNVFWEYFAAVARQAADDSGVSLEMILYDEFESSAMVDDLASLSRSCVKTEMCAAVVSIPNDAVREAVRDLTAGGQVAVFGVNSGYPGAGIGLEGYFGADEVTAGALAAEEVLLRIAAVNKPGQPPVKKRVAFVDHLDGTVQGLVQRWSGFQARVEEGGATAHNIGHLPMRGESELAVVLTDLMYNASTGDCLYDAAVAGGAEVAYPIIEALRYRGCLGETVVGHFDESEELYEEMELGLVAFAMCQQTWTQAYYAVFAAAIFSFTGASMAQGSGMPTGPIVRTTPPPLRLCIDDGFPTCEAASHASNRGCSCTNRTEIRIAGVIPEDGTNTWWDLVDEGVSNAASGTDLGVTLVSESLIRTGLGDDAALASQLDALCGDGSPSRPAAVDGLFVKITSPEVHDSVTACIAAGVTVLSFNSGYEGGALAVPGLLCHVGMREFATAFEGALKLVAAGATELACVVDRDDAASSNMAARCAGVEKAAAQASLPFAAAEVRISNDGSHYLDETVRDLVAGGGIGMVLTDSKLIQPTELAMKNNNAIIQSFVGSFDLTDASLAKFEAGRLTFVTDQFRYLQGYLPVVLLASHIATEQQLLVDLVPTGAGVVVGADAAAEIRCSIAGFEACLPADEGSSSASSKTVDSRLVEILVPICAFLGVLALAFCFQGELRVCLHKTKVRKLKMDIQELKDAVVGVRICRRDFLPRTSDDGDGGDDDDDDDDDDNNDDDGTTQPAAASTRESSAPLTATATRAPAPSTSSTATWYWREDKQRLGNHDPKQVKAPYWVAYPAALSADLDRALAAGEETVDAGGPYVVQVQRRCQVNTRTGFTREVLRQADAPPALRKKRMGSSLLARVGDETPVLAQQDSSNATSRGGGFYKVPDFLQEEGALLMRAGSLIQVSKQRDDGWAYGTVAFGENKAGDADLAMRGTFAGSISLTTGWFPIDYTDTPTMDELKALQDLLGASGTLDVPPAWEPVADPHVAEFFRLAPKSAEYRQVTDEFLSTLDKSRVKILSVDRVENVAMWQSFAVKRQTIFAREPDEARQASRFERRLWHGTSSDALPKIVQQGFNRSFCGKNATMYGKGVYFARDALYSFSRTYAVPDQDGVQHMFWCRVVVGDYCRGVRDALTPDVREGLTLYDSTVNHLSDPSIFVTYHDAQAYPEYLLRFRQR